MRPKTFSYKKNPSGLDFRYIAQDLMKNGFGELVMVSTSEELEEYVDEDGFVSEKDKLYTISRSQIIPILHQCIQDLYAKIERLEKTSKSLDEGIIQNIDPILPVDPYEIIHIKGKKIKIKKKIS